MSEDEKEFSCLEPFDIDQDELAGIDAVNAFALGVEWQMVRVQLEVDNAPIIRPIHSANAGRIKRMCIRRGRRVKVEPLAEGWHQLEVEEKDTP